MSLLKEFKEFAMKGNAIDLAVGVVIGGAFQTIVTSLVNDVIMPFTSILTGNVDYKDWIIEIGTSKIQIGSFITAVINFLIIAFTIFLVLKYMNKLNQKLDELNRAATEKMNKKAKRKNKKEEIKKEPDTKICPYCLSEVPYKATKCSHCTSDLIEKIVE